MPETGLNVFLDFRRLLALVEGYITFEFPGTTLGCVLVGTFVVAL